MEINEHTLIKLIEKASEINPEDKNNLYFKMLSIIEGNEPKAAAQEALQLTQELLKNKISDLAGDLTNPKSAIPKKAVFRRVDDQAKDDDPIQVENGIGLKSGMIILK